MAQYNTPKMNLARKIAKQDIEVAIKVELNTAIANYYGFNTPEELKREYHRLVSNVNFTEAIIKRHFEAENNDSLIRTLKTKRYAYAVNLNNEVTRRFYKVEEVTGEIVFIDDVLYFELIENEQYIKFSDLVDPNLLSDERLKQKRHELQKQINKALALTTVFRDDWNVNGKYLFNEEQYALNNQIPFLKSR